MELGYSSAQILPIFEGFPIISAFEFSNSCGYELTKKLKESIIELNLEKIDCEVLEDIIFSFIKIPLRKQYKEYFSSQENVEKMKKRIYKLDTNKKRIRVINLH